MTSQVKFPPGTYVTWSGQFEYLQRAKSRLQVVVPVTVLIIFLLLYLNFRRVTETLIVMLSVPFALVGGLWLMWWLGFNLSVAVAVGFIALAGVAAETGVVMLIYLDGASPSCRAPAREGRPFTPRRSLRRDHERRGRAGAAEDDDRLRHHGGAAADHVEPRHRRRGDAAHRRADDRRHGVVDLANADRDSGDLRGGQRQRYDRRDLNSLQRRDRSVGMHDMMMNSGMMWGMALVWFLVVILLILGIAALVKYVFFR